MVGENVTFFKSINSLRILNWSLFQDFSGHFFNSGLDQNVWKGDWKSDFIFRTYSITDCILIKRICTCPSQFSFHSPIIKKLILQYCFISTIQWNIFNPKIKMQGPFGLPNVYFFLFCNGVRI